MLDVPPHLFQSLSVDTNISYDLDMSKFPGLDDPHQMYEPALLIATDWSDFVYNDAFGVNVDTDGSGPEDDLFSLIESCSNIFPEVDFTDAVDTDSFESLLDDVITDSDSDMFSTDSLESVHFTDTELNVTNVDSDTYSAECYSLNVDVVSCVRRSTKRRRSVDEYPDTTKKSKMADTSKPDLPLLVSVSTASKNTAVYRES